MQPMKGSFIRRHSSQTSAEEKHQFNDDDSSAQ